MSTSLFLLAALLQPINPVDDIPVAEMTEWGAAPESRRFGSTGRR